jgi:RNA polymerase sigma-70 factor, ECF subfamily
MCGTVPAADALTATSAAVDFEVMVRAYRPRIFRFVFASLRDGDAADSLTQDCFFNAFRAWNTFRGECSLDTWLMRIAVNLVRDYGRNRRLQFWKRTRERSEPLDTCRLIGPARSPEAQLLLREKVEAVWHAAGKLPERQRTVFLLRFVEDMDLLDIAAATGMKEGTVKAHLFTALRTVRRRMGATA